jgi:hypothetical protein
MIRTKVLLDIEVNEYDVEQMIYMDSYAGPLRKGEIL